MACLAVHVELHCGAARGDEPADVSSAWAWVGSHWRSVVLLLDGGTVPWTRNHAKHTPLPTGRRALRAYYKLSAVRTPLARDRVPGLALA